MDKVEQFIGMATAMIEIVEVNVFFGTLEYLLSAVNFFSSRAGFDIESRYKDKLMTYRDWAQRLCMHWAQRLARVHVELINNDTVTDDRVTLYMYTHAAFADAMFARKIDINQVLLCLRNAIISERTLWPKCHSWDIA